MDVAECLKDAGCGSELIERFIQLTKEHKLEERQQLLASHRRILLDTVHAHQKQIDCLDYLIFEIRKQKC